MPGLVDPVPLLGLDRPRTLLFDRRAVKGAEVALAALWGPDVTFYSAMQDLALVLTDGNLGRLRFSSLSILLWQGLRADDPALTLDEVEELLPYSDPPALVPLIGKVIEAWWQASPQPEPGATEVSADSDPLGVSTGAPSGPSSALASA